MQMFVRFTPTLTRPAPWGYAIAPGDTAALSLARLHGLEVSRLTSEWRGDAGPQFVADTTIVAPQAVEGRRLVRVAGRWETGRPVTLAAGSHVIRLAQPLGVLAMYLLEPESDDGLVAWDVGGRSSGTAGSAPVIRLQTELRVPMTVLPRANSP